MTILRAIKREEQKLKKQLGTLQKQLDGLQTAAKALAYATERQATVAKKRVLSAVTKAKIAKSARQRWAKIRAQARKAAA